MKRIALSLIAIAALALACSPVQAFGGLAFRARYRQRVVVQRFVAAPQVYAPPVIFQPIYSQPVYSQANIAQPVHSQQFVTPGCSQFFYAR